jgi:phage-related protein
MLPDRAPRTKFFCGEQGRPQPRNVYGDCAGVSQASAAPWAYKYPYTGNVDREPKAVRWIGSVRKDWKAFPKTVQRHLGQALFAAQCGEEYPTVKVLKGFGGRSVLEIVVDHDSDTWRAVYTVRFPSAVYVLHAFQKKSKTGIGTPKRDIELIQQRLYAAERDYRERQN